MKCITIYNHIKQLDWQYTVLEIPEVIGMEMAIVLSEKISGGRYNEKDSFNFDCFDWYD